MSVKIMGQVWDADLPKDEKFVLLAYADHADHTGGNVYPSIGLIAWKTGYSERSVQRATHELEEAGIMLQTGRAQHNVKRWRILTSKLPKRTDWATIRAGVTGCQGDNDDAPGVTTTTSRGDTVSPESSRIINESSTTTTPDYPNAFAAYQNAGGGMGPMVADSLGELIADCEGHRLALHVGVPGWGLTGDEWVTAAIVTAIDAGARISPNYIKAILDRWKAEGYRSERKATYKSNGSAKKSNVEQSLENIADWAARDGG